MVGWILDYNLSNFDHQSLNAESPATSASASILSEPVTSHNLRPLKIARKLEIDFKR